MLFFFVSVRVWGKIQQNKIIFISFVLRVLPLVIFPKFYLQQCCLSASLNFILSDPDSPNTVKKQQQQQVCFLSGYSQIRSVMVKRKRTTWQGNGRRYQKLKTISEQFFIISKASQVLLCTCTFYSLYIDNHLLITISKNFIRETINNCRA